MFFGHFAHIETLHVWQPVADCQMKNTSPNRQPLPYRYHYHSLTQTLPYPTLSPTLPLPFPFYKHKSESVADSKMFIENLCPNRQHIPYPNPTKTLPYLLPFYRLFKNISPNRQPALSCRLPIRKTLIESNRKAMNRNWSNQKANPALKTKTGINKYYK